MYEDLILCRLMLEIILGKIYLFALFYLYPNSMLIMVSIRYDFFPVQMGSDMHRLNYHQLLREQCANTTVSPKTPSILTIASPHLYEPFFGGY